MPHFKRLLFKHDTSLCKRPSFERPFFKQMSTVIGSDCCSHVHVRDREDAATRSDDCTYRSSAALIACCEAAACQAAGHDAPSRFPPLSSGGAQTSIRPASPPKAAPKTIPQGVAPGPRSQAGDAAWGGQHFHTARCDSGIGALHF